MPKEILSAPAQVFEQAVALFRQGRLADAETILAGMLRQWPGSFDALHLLGIIRLQSGKPKDALGLFESALKANPNSPEVLANLAMALAALRREEEAVAIFGQAHALDPNDWQTLNNRGSLLMRLNRAPEALADFDRAIAIEPRHAGLHLNRGNALAQIGRFAGALVEYDSVLATQPNLPEAHFNRGNALSSLDRAAQAIAAFDRALSIRPDYFKALVSRAVALMALNRHRDAITDLDRALAIDKTSADAHNNLALALLTIGDYRRGFEEYEWRWRRTGMPPPRNLRKPLWVGDYPLARKTILLHGEQGLGDTIQFVRYAPMLARAGARILIETQRELAAVLARVEGVAAVVARGDPLPAFDVHCPLGSLPRAFKTEPSTIPAHVPYLKAHQERVAAWRARLAGVASPRLAIAWSGSPSHPNDRNRSFALSLLEPIMSLGHVNVVSIQRELRLEDAALIVRSPRVIHVGEELKDFDDTAAVVSLADLVLSVDTSVAHLAGALGRPTWILLPFSPDWRWMLGREDTPWYPSARLFRQAAPGDWAGVIAKVTGELIRSFAAV